MSLRLLEGKMTNFLYNGISRRDPLKAGALGSALLLGNTRLAGAQANDSWLVAWAQVGPVGGAGWTYQQDVARRELEKRLPWVKTTQVESVGPSDMQRVIEDFVAQGAKVVLIQD